jgi:SAM-dependent methyltransferase
MSRVQIVKASEKFDWLAPTYDDLPEGENRLWDGEALVGMLGDISGVSILDVGCGTGRLMKRLERLGAETMGVDISTKMVEKARAKSLLVLQGDITQFSWNERFDVVISVLTLNYIREKAKALESIWYLLKLGGVLLISSDLEKNDVPVYRGDDLVAAQYFPVSKDGYWRLLAETGFDIRTSVDLFKPESSRGILEQLEPVGFVLKAQKTHELPEEDWRA